MFWKKLLGFSIAIFQGKLYPSETDRLTKSMASLAVNQPILTNRHALQMRITSGFGISVWGFCCSISLPEVLEPSWAVLKRIFSASLLLETGCFRSAVDLALQLSIMHGASRTGNKEFCFCSLNFKVASLLLVVSLLSLSLDHGTFFVKLHSNPMLLQREHK